MTHSMRWIGASFVLHEAIKLGNRLVIHLGRDRLKELHWKTPAPARDLGISEISSFCTALDARQSFAVGHPETGADRSIAPEAAVGASVDPHCIGPHGVRPDSRPPQFVARQSYT